MVGICRLYSPLVLSTKKTCSHSRENRFFVYSPKEDVGHLLLHINYPGRAVGALLNTYSMRCFHTAATQVVICLGDFAVGLGEFPDGFILSVDDEDIGVQTAFWLLNHNLIHRLGNVDSRLLQETVVGSRFHMNAAFHLEAWTIMYMRWNSERI